MFEEAFADYDYVDHYEGEDYNLWEEEQVFQDHVLERLEEEEWEAEETPLDEWVEEYDSAEY